MSHMMSLIEEAQAALQLEGTQVCVFQLSPATAAAQNEQSAGEPVGQLLFTLYSDGRFESRSVGDLPAMTSKMGEIVEARQSAEAGAGAFDEPNDEQAPAD
ncbi:hypothetical protein CFN79_00890 [Chromobacterium vaccinii]|uniref:hypothetical protein n=1 Tax=Chromobacterium vaccinii TaxID=1108595 RepID=UPI000CE95E8E|nr:hypothetical protein [Chromobacterium vaccinii]AVG14543.1 hypothetical protein CFN79_00890 [Chromobacterium vaccinii]